MATCWTRRPSRREATLKPDSNTLLIRPRKRIVFAYLGPREKMPLFPHYEWARLPKEQTYVTKGLLECNYLQGLEGECDSSHLSFLHREFTASGRRQIFALDSAPEYETEETDFGVRLLATR